MRKIEQLRISVPARTRRSIALLMATCGVLVATMVFGSVSSAQATADSSANTSSAHATADESSAYSGGHLVAADPCGGYWIVNGVGAITTHGGAAVFGSPSLSGITLSRLHDAQYRTYFNFNDGVTNSIITGGDFPAGLASYIVDLD
jgi:hypothetical protein